VAPSLNVYSSPEAAACSTALDMTQERVEQCRAELERNWVSECPDVPLTEEVMAGDPVRIIVDYARAHQVDLIVMATHGYGALRRFVLGSVTGAVLHDTGCPVWTGAHLEKAPNYDKIGFRRILCAIDLARGSRAVLEWAGRFSREFGSELSIVHVLPHSLVETGGMYFDPAWRQDAIAEARQEIGQLLRETGTEGEVLIEIGETAMAIGDVAASRGIDLVVIGRGQASGLLGRLRSKAYPILRESPCPVAAV
jgi:nucleotide-binding universal stress UspA family protein